MTIKFRLILMNFMQFFIWGAWLLTVGDYCSNHMHWTFTQFGAIFSTMGISAIFMPALIGIVADKYFNAEKLYGVLHLLGAIMLFCIPLIKDPFLFFWAMLFNMLFYMPTLSLSITIAYSALKNNNEDVVTAYPAIRTIGTVGFIIALLTITVTHNEQSANQFYIASAAAFILGVYSFWLPSCPPLYNKAKQDRSLVDLLGLKAFTLFKTPKFAIFFSFSMLLGAALQLTNAYGTTYIDDFKTIAKFHDTFPVRYPAGIMAISQLSETIFILTIPFFLRRFGIKNVMLFSMIAWVLRFGLFAFGDPAGGLWMIILSCIVYGMAFDFFNISGSLFIETQTNHEIRASAQGLFMMMVNGFGALLGSFASGIIIDKYFTLANGSKNWHGIWLCFAGYALVIAIIFPFIFRFNNDTEILTGAEPA